jgi:hypothetical protein
VVLLKCLSFNSSRRNCDVQLMLFERSWQFKFNGIYVVRFGLKIVRNMNFSVIFVTENSNNFFKTKFLEGKIRWECGNIWRLTIQFKHDFLSKWCHMLCTPYIITSSHLGHQHKPH